MFRKIYYFFSPSFRFFIRKIIFSPIDLLSSFKNDLVPPRGMIYTGSGDFIKQGEEWRQFFIEHADLQPEDHVLDIGSGIGRIALGLLPFLKGEYTGFDAVKIGVDWCSNHISPHHPNFRFYFIDLFNDLYKNKGISAASFEFPYAQDSFDFICAISVFTHLLPEEVENYIHQIYKVLKPGSKAVLTFFILDDDSISYMQNTRPVLKFDLQPDKSFALMHPKVKSANVAYQRKYLERIVSSNGMEIVASHPGYWCGRPKQSDLIFQDVLIIRKH